MSARISSLLVPLEELSQEPYLSILCYPKPDTHEGVARIYELKTLGVDGLIFEGRSQLGRLKILGKGCVSIVVKAKAMGAEYALKIRRVDANRPSMEREAALHTYANKVNVGPRLFAISRNFILMELVEGMDLVRWVKDLHGKGSVNRLREVLKTLTGQCFCLDQAGLDHGELSNLGKHVYVNGNVVILDFETSSNHRRVRNLTSTVQYLFIGGPISKKIRRLLNLHEVELIINALKEYKHAVNLSSYQRLLNSLKLVKIQ